MSTSLPLLESTAAGASWLSAEPLFRRSVLLICPPYQSLGMSSLSITQLATLLRSQGVPCTEGYLHFELARLISEDAYRKLSNDDEAIGELLFAEGLHGSIADAELHRALERAFGSKPSRAAILEAVEHSTLALLDKDQPELVGITTSLHQLLPSLWLAKVIKQHSPQTVVVLGGSGCAEPMGTTLLEAYPQVDYVVSGYGERPLLALATEELPSERLIQNNEQFDLDQLPVPDYSAFVKAAEAHGANYWLTFESSRGCWWGEKNHCKFCGLNGGEMIFRQKSSERVVNEVRALWDQHHRRLFATDTILSRQHLREAIPKLGEYEEGPPLFYEMKVNVSESDVQAMSSANVRMVQPGVESLSTRLLGLLKKGSETIHNLALLKWCRENRIVVRWNQLCAIPGEELLDYVSQFALMSKVPHFSPPDCANPIRIDRYSPYFKNYADHGWSEIRPLPHYASLHPQLSAEQLAQVAYHFEGRGGVSCELYLDHLKSAIEAWKVRHERGDGLFIDAREGLFMLREGRVGKLRPHPSTASILEHTHQITPVNRVISQTGCTQADLERLESHGVLYIENGRVINLAVRTTEFKGASGRQTCMGPTLSGDS